MTMLFVAVFTPNSTNIHQSRGLKEAGHDVIEYDFRTHSNPNKDIISLTQSLNPDVVLFSKANNIHFSVIDECNKYSKTILWYMDALHNFNNELIDKVKRCTSFVCGVEGVVKEASKYSKNVHFVQQCYDENLNYKTDIVQDINISFIGTNDAIPIHSNRQPYINYLRNNFNTFTPFSGVFGEAHNVVVNRTKINLNFTPTDKTGTSVRLHKILGAGGFLMTTPWDDMEKSFTPGKDFVVFNSQEELKEKIEYYLTHTEEREAIKLHGNNTIQKCLPKQWAIETIETIL